MVRQAHHERVYILHSVRTEPVEVSERITFIVAYFKEKSNATPPQRHFGRHRRN
jgi:hypothetical protein